MYLYTQSHVTQVFFIGLLNGVLASMIYLEFKNDFALLKRAFRQFKRIKRKNKASVKTKIPTAANSEYQVQ